MLCESGRDVMTNLPLWMRRVTMEIIIRASNRVDAENLTEEMVHAAVKIGREAKVDASAMTFFEFSGDAVQLVEKHATVPRTATTEREI